MAGAAGKNMETQQQQANSISNTPTANPSATGSKHVPSDYCNRSRLWGLGTDLAQAIGRHTGMLPTLDHARDMVETAAFHQAAHVVLAHAIYGVTAPSVGIACFKKSLWEFIPEPATAFLPKNPDAVVGANPRLAEKLLGTQAEYAAVVAVGGVVEQWLRHPNGYDLAEFLADEEHPGTEVGTVTDALSTLSSDYNGFECLLETAVQAKTFLRTKAAKTAIGRIAIALMSRATLNDGELTALLGDVPAFQWTFPKRRRSRK